MKNTLAQVLRGSAFSGLALGAVWTMYDASEFHQVLASQYQTPWYTSQWVKSPYTHLQLLGQPSKQYWTRNAIGTETWLVREVKYGQKTFWTTLVRKPV